MSRLVQGALLAAVLGMAGQQAWAQTAERARYEKILIEQFPDYRPIQPEEFSREALHDVLAPRELPADPGLLVGNFNGDRYPDFAALIAHRKSEAERFPGANPYPDAHQVLLVVCLSRGPRNFDCQYTFSYFSMRGTPPKCDVAIWKGKPQRRLAFWSLGRFVINPKNGYTFSNPIENWWEHARAMGITPVPKEKLDEDSVIPLGYIRQRYESVWAMPQYGRPRRTFWVSHAGLIACCE
jgi:hypothetical protein